MERIRKDLYFIKKAILLIIQKQKRILKSHPCLYQVQANTLKDGFYFSRVNAKNDCQKGSVKFYDENHYSATFFCVKVRFCSEMLFKICVPDYNIVTSMFEACHGSIEQLPLVWKTFWFEN